MRKYECIACQRDSLFRGCVGLLCWALRGWRGVHSQPLDNHGRPNHHNTPPTLINTRSFIHSFCQKPESASMAAQSGAKFQPLPSAYVDQPKNLCCSKNGCSYFPVSVFISWFWQVINPAWCCWIGWMVKPNSFIALGSIFLIIIMGLLPAMMLRQGVTQGRPARFTKYR